MRLELFTLVAIMIYCVVSFGMGIRLLSMARRTREVPELLIGLAFLAGGGIGYPFSVGAGVLHSASNSGAAASYAIGQIGILLAAFFVLLSWRNIFAPSMRGGGILVAAWTAALVATTTLVIVTTTPVASESLAARISWVQFVIQGACYGIVAWASLRHAQKVRRQCALGLADPLVANRLLLWGFSNLSIMASYIYSLLTGILLSREIANIYNPVLIASFGLTAACFITLSFLPPRAYIERIRARSTSEGA